jgi:hypothetical protein
MVVVERSGRHRYYRLAGSRVAAMLDAVAQVAPPRRVRGLRDAVRSDSLRTARMCYDHLAGRLGVALLDGLLEREIVCAREGMAAEVSYELTDGGRDRLAALGVALPDGGRRPLVRHCVDWSERRHHLAGAAGAALARWVLGSGWATRATTGRAVLVTAEGRTALRRHLGLAI